MQIDEYERRVIELFKSGSATDEQWQEMAACVLGASEINDAVPAIDAAVGREGADNAD